MQDVYVHDPHHTKPDLRLVAAVFVVAAAILIMRAVVGVGTGPLFADTDDAMRMVVVHDFLAGQNWYDPIQHRLNTPWGAEIHWSRLIDLPLAAIVLVFTPILGAANADIAAGYLWPLLLLAALLWLSARLALRLVGPEGVLPALVLPVLSPAITAEFVPGRVDHHNVIIILTLAIAWTTIEAIRRPRFAIACGLLCASALAIATESLPTIAATILASGFLWVLDPGKGRTTRSFGLAFAIGAMVHLAIYRPPARWFEAACDVLSPVYVAMALVVAAAFVIATMVPTPRQAWQRFALLAVLGLAGIGVVLALYPACIKGPYAELDAWLQANWINNISEAKPWIAAVFELPSYVIAVSTPVILAVFVVIYRLWRVREERGEWLAMLVFLLAAAVVMLAQVRGARLAFMPSIPAAAWLIVYARHRYLAAPRLLPILGLVGSWLAFSGVIMAVLVAAITNLASNRVGDVAEIQARKELCLMPGAYVDLAALPPERIMTPIDLGAHMLLNTPHAVVGAPYHRNEQGVRDTFRFFNDPIAEARTIIDERGIGLVVTCPAMSEMGGFADRAEDSFISLLAKSALPNWLEDVSLPGSPLKVYAVLPQ